MRKKFIAVYALMAVLALGSTTLTSCVDDTESATVTAMRDARLRQLQALADQEEAQAKIDAITAQMKEATSEAELAVLKAKYEQELAYYQQQKAKAEQEMATGLNQYQADLYEDYTNAIDKVNLLANDIAEESLDLIQLKADSSTAAAYAKEQIIKANRKIAYQEALKKNYEALTAVDIEELKAKKAEAKVAQTEKDKALNLANNSKTEAENAFTNAKADIVRRYVYQETINNETVTKISETEPTHISDYETLEPTNEVALAAYTLNDLGNSGDIDENWRTDIATTKPVKVSEESETYINQFEILASTLSQVTRLVESKVKEATDDLGTEGDKSDKNTAWGKHQQLVETLEAAQKAYNDAVKADPKGDHSNLLNRVKDAQEAVDTDLEKERDKFGNETLLYYQKQAEKAEAIQTKFNEAVAVFNDATKYKTYTDRVAAILAKEGKAKDAAKDAYWSAMQELAIAEANLESINNLIANTLDPETLIAQCDTKIALEKETLAKAEALIYIVDANGTVSDREAAYADLIENAEKKIEYLEAEKDLQQKMAEQYKSQLEASLNSGSAE